ncbi:RICIN domain-containing protein [Kitasatospora purpeofusca]|uniref:RICIN domain-containing protein n=1 Tax=Kitasatospora purpeofusca TaxID=67352 RepID=UPI00225B01C8|nr:RICIN domain-containing protein [Kitasatospora purpeofusca]MCX4756217.1 RICIN domain-containing protein [Kitasatospora purpeofusca]WSR35952.1 RICIN domain-containing protein [Kitasatospora purpeofusca]
MSAPAAMAAAPTPAAGSQHGPTAGLAPLVPSKPAPPRTAEQQATLDAITKARSTGKPVTVEALTTEVSTTTANPSGTLTTTDNAQTVRTKRGGAWADIDPALRANADGTLSPAVSTVGLRFSGGGTGPMATVTTDDGKSLAVKAPFPLPKPSVSGADAVYTDVLPGVDLRLSALPQGGWRDVIVVRTKEAAESPALKSLTFPVSAQGLSVSADQAGGITVVDDRGSIRFRSPAPLQWDSSKPAASPATAERATRSVARTALSAAPAGTGTEGVTGTPSIAEEPGDGANVAVMATKVTPAAIELTPNPGALGSGDGPWYLDPSLVEATSSSQGSVEVQENHKGSENFNKKSNLATGYCGYRSSDPNLDCGTLGRQRAYFQFGINPALYTKPSGADSAPTIYSSTLNAQVTAASSPGTNTPFVVYSAPGPIHEHTSWNNQPCGTDGRVVMQNCPAVSDTESLTGTGPLAFDVTETMKQAIGGQWPSWAAVIAPQGSEFEKLYRHHLASNPSITTTYDIAPTIWYPRTSPAPGFAGNNSTAECTSGGTQPWDNPGWVGSNQNIYLTANSWSPAGQPLYTGYQMWDDNDPNFSAVPGSWGGSYNDPGPTAGVGSLSDGHQYGWLARSTDELLTSPSSAWCYFRVDRTNPRVSISSTDFPPSGTPNPSPAKYMNDWGRFWINGEDPAPGAGLQASGIACLRVSTDPTPVVGWRCGQNNTVSPGQPYDFQPRRWGTNTLYAWAMDNAGNYSQPAVYNFYAPWKPGTQPLFGDVTNDQQPDIVLTDKSGDLRIIGGTVDPMNSLVAPAAAAPGNLQYGATWADYQISHHGALLAGQAVDQLVVHYTGASDELRKVLYVIPNDGTGRFDQTTPIAPTRPTSCKVYGTTTACPGYSSSTGWSNVSQVIAFGTPKGEAVGPKVGDPTKTVFTTQTSIMTLENNELYVFTPAGNLLTGATLIPTASGSWSDYELLNPGAANGATTNPLTKANANQTTLWARNRSDGNIYAYPLAWNADGTVDYTALTKPDSGTLILSGSGLLPSSHPRIGAGDLNNDGYPDLWVVDNTNAIAVFPGKSSDGTANKVDGFDNWQLVGYADASVSVHPNSVSWQCLDAIGGPRDGAEAAIYNCWQTANQRFSFATDGTIRAGSYCLSTKDNVLGNGAPVVLATCTGKTGQKWAMRPDGRIYLPATVDPADSPAGKCLELPGWATDQGTRVGIWDCPGLQANQQWTLQPERNP